MLTSHFKHSQAVRLRLTASLRYAFTYLLINLFIFYQELKEKMSEANVVSGEGVARTSVGVGGIEPHIYVMNLKKNMIKKNKQMRKVLNMVNNIYVIFDSVTHVPETIELHYADDELEDPYSLKGSRYLHRVYQFPKVPLKFYKEFTAETSKLVLIYDNWKSKWHVHECSEKQDA